MEGHRFPTLCINLSPNYFFQSATLIAIKTKYGKVIVWHYSKIVTRIMDWHDSKIVGWNDLRDYFWVQISPISTSHKVAVKYRNQVLADSLPQIFGFFPRLEIIINSDAMVEDCQKQMSTRQNIRKKFLLLFEICAIVSITTFTHSTLTIYFTLVREHKVRHKKEIPTGICFELKSCLCLLHPFRVDIIKYQLITG